MTLQQLLYFIAAVEHGSLSAAAVAAGVAQPSLSDQVRRLERTLGVQLFVRTHRRLLLTEAGQLFLPEARRTLAAAREAAESVQGVRTLTGGTLTFGTVSSSTHLLLPELVVDFRAQHPHVRIRLLSLNSSQVAEAVREGHVESGIVALPVDDRGLTISPVVWTSEAVYFSADPDHVRRPPSVESLCTATLILPEVRNGNDDPTRRQLLERAQIAGVVLEPAVEVESPATALELAVRGVGDTVISLPLAARLGATSALHWTSLDPPLEETFAFVSRRGTDLAPASRAMMRLVAQRLRLLPQGQVPAST